MFKNFLLSLLLLNILFTLSSCEKLSTNVSDVTGGSGLKATIDGSQWTALTATAIKQSQGGVSIIFISGVASDGSTLTIGIPNNTVVGTFDLASTEIAINYNKLPDAYLATSGSLAVTAISSSSISGTFNFKSTSSTSNKNINVTNGSFNLKM